MSLQMYRTQPLNCYIFRVSELEREIMLNYLAALTGFIERSKKLKVREESNVNAK